MSPNPPEMTPALNLFFALACGVIVANLYYAQPLAGPIAASLGLPPAHAGLIVTLTQLGYALGLVLLVPLGDLVENRRLVVSILVLGTLAVAAAALSTHPAPFLLACLAIGIGSVSVQVLVPFAAHLAPEASRGRVVGNVMSGLMVGIMLARPVGSLIASVSSWHMVFVVATVLMVAIGVAMRIRLPRWEPEPGHSYGSLLVSLAGLLWRTKVLQRRAFYHFFLFGAFSLFWTVTPLWLAQNFGIGQAGIAVFALIGVAGTIAAPLAGRLADAGHTRIATFGAMICVATGLSLCLLAGGTEHWRLGVLALAGVVLDFGVSGNLVLGQRALFALGPATRARLNGLYLAVFFLGGACGSALGGWAYGSGGWAAAVGTGLGLVGVALAAFALWRGA